MSDLTAREADPAEWDTPVVELVEDGRVVGMAYLDGDTLFAEFTPDEEGDPWAFEVNDLQIALDTAAAMLLPDPGKAPDGDASSLDDNPVDVLAAEFDSRAAHRGEEDEGFYPPQVAGRMVQRAEVLGLAVVSLEGCRLVAGEASPIPGMSVDIGDAHDGEPFPTFLAGCNVQAMALVEKWARQPEVLFSIEVGDEDGERYLL